MSPDFPNRLDGRVNRCETDLGHLQRVLDHAVEVGVRVRGDESRGEFGRRLAGLVRVHDRISNDLAYAVMRIDHDLDAGLLEEAEAQSLRSIVMRALHDTHDVINMPDRHGSGFDRYRRLGVVTVNRRTMFKPYSTQYNARNTRTASDRAATSSLTFACRTTTDTVESAIPRRSAISAVE